MNDIKDELNEQLHCAWLEPYARIISFHAIPSGQLFQARGADFWPYILSLVTCGWRVQ